MGPGRLDLTWGRVDLTWHGVGSTQLDLILVWLDSARPDPGLTRLSSTWAQSRLSWLNLTWARVDSAGLGSVSSWLDLGHNDLTGSRPGSTRLDLGMDQLSSTYARANSNPIKNLFWIIQKYIQSISNPYPIKWIGFVINPFKWIKSKGGHGLDFFKIQSRSNKMNWI